jgi:hypothetical protein
MVRDAPVNYDGDVLVYMMRNLLVNHDGGGAGIP